MRIGRYFILGLWVFGAAAGLVAAASPTVRAWPIPTLVWPLLAALAVDLALMPLAKQGHVEPLTMNERALAVIGSALIMTLILAATA
jgi:hypothetical protein